MFITFEGLDGTGKTTHGQLLVGWLNSLGKTALYTREPGGTKLGVSLRRFLLDSQEYQVVPAAEVLLMAADRAQHVQEVIAPALAQGQIVVCDRYVDSSLAYQGFGLGYPLESVQRVNVIATEGLVPDITFWLDATTEELTGRLQRRELGADKIEDRGRGFHERVRAGYHHLIAQEPERFCVVNVGKRKVSDVQEEIRAVVKERLGLKLE